MYLTHYLTYFFKYLTGRFRHFTARKQVRGDESDNFEILVKICLALPHTIRQSIHSWKNPTYEWRIKQYLKNKWEAFQAAMAVADDVKVPSSPPASFFYALLPIFTSFSPPSRSFLTSFLSLSHLLLAPFSQSPILV